MVAQPPAKKAKSEPKKTAPPAKKEEEKVVSTTEERGCSILILGSEFQRKWFSLKNVTHILLCLNSTTAAEQQIQGSHSVYNNIA